MNCNKLQNNHKIDILIHKKSKKKTQEFRLERLKKNDFHEYGKKGKYSNMGTS